MSRPDKVALSRRLTSMEQMLNTIANRVSDTFDEHRFVPYLLLTLFSLAYFTITRYHAVRKLFWYDELFTIYLSRLPDLGSVWVALMNGVDFNPPLIYPLTRFSETVFGQGHLGARLPEILAFWIFCLCLFRFVFVRSSVLGAMISALFPIVTTAYWYAYDARPHAIVLGFCGVSLICWQAATERTRGRLGWLLGMGLSLICALLTHSYAFLVFFPLVCGEFSRAVVNRKPDWPIWGTLAMSSTAIGVSLPLLHVVKSSPATTAPFAVTFFLPTGSKLIHTYTSTLAPAATVLVASFVFLLLVRTTVRREPTRPHRSPRAHEIFALFAFIAIPVAADIVARLMAAPLLPRYSISLVAGVACLLGLAAARKPAVAIAIVILLVAQIGISAQTFRRSVTLTEPSSNKEISTSSPLFQERYRWIRDAKSEGPIVVLHAFEGMSTWYYAPPDLVSRVVYVMWWDGDNLGANIASLKTWCGAPFPYPIGSSEFLASNDRFLVFGENSELPGLSRFVGEGATVAIERISDDHFLAAVHYPKRADVGTSETNFHTTTAWSVSEIGATP